MPTSVYYPNSTNCTAYKWSEVASGDQRNKSPNDRGKTPSDIITEGTEMTSTEKNTVSTDDNNYVRVYGETNIAATSVRGAVMVKYVISESESIVDQLDQLCRAAWYNDLEVNGWVYFYLWDFDASTWYDLNDAIQGLTKDTHTSTISTNPEKYIDGSGVIYFLVWDYSGYYKGAGGCLPEGDQLQLFNGSLKAIEQLKIGDVLRGWVPNRFVPSTVIKKSAHELKEWDLYRIETEEAFTQRLTPLHPIYTNFGVDIPPRIDPAYQKLLRIRKPPKIQFLTIDDIIREKQTVRVYNVEVAPTENYLNADGILIHNRAKAWA